MQENNKTVSVQNSEELVGLVRRRAQNLYETHQLLCSEAVLYVLNQGLGGDLSPEAAIRLGSGFTEGIGGAGCMCGAFSGAVMATGLFLGRNKLNGRGLKRIQTKGRELHDLFRSKFGSTCCRVLIKKVKDNDTALFKQCAIHTGEAAGMAARLILEARPHLVDRADWSFLSAQDSVIGAGVKRLFTFFESKT